MKKNDDSKSKYHGRLSIDKQLKLAGLKEQTWSAVNLGEDLGLAIREYPTDSAFVDYILFVNRKAVGVIEAQKDDSILSQIEDQTLRYATSKIQFQSHKQPLSLLFEELPQALSKPPLQLTAWNVVERLWVT